MTPTSLRQSLVWNADMVVTTPFGERWWLRELSGDGGNRLGITECCPEEAPCGWHAALAARCSARSVHDPD